MSSALPQIEHIVFLMLENRSFDNLLGWLYEGDDRPNHIIASPQQKDMPFQGLAPETYFNCFPDDSTSHYVRRGTRTWDTPSTDPHEPHQHVNLQLFDYLPRLTSMQNQPLPGQQPTMGGFLKDFLNSHAGVLAPACDEPDPVGALARALSRPLTRDEALQIMESFSPEQLPVINGLAKAFAVSDQWFSSVPTQTMANRAFSVCGDSMGLVNNKGFLFGLVPDRNKTRSIWQVLTEAGYGTPADWMVYYQSLEEGMFCLTEQAFNIPDSRRHVTDIGRFFEAVRRNELPSFSYLEPAWYNVLPPWTNGNSYHPPSDVVPGELFLKQLYDALSRNPEIWRKTLLMITFDEHGGTYDHVPPPWGAVPPWGSGNTPPYPLEDGFGFDRFGVRVPTLLISPWINERTVFRSPTGMPYDHTSIISTILSWKGIPRDQWKMGARVDAAPTFEGVLNRTTPRTDRPAIELSEAQKAHLADMASADDGPPTPMQLKLLPFVLRHACGGVLGDAQLLEAMAEILKGAETSLGLIDRVKDFAARYDRA